MVQKGAIDRIYDATSAIECDVSWSPCCKRFWIFIFKVEVMFQFIYCWRIFNFTGKLFTPPSPRLRAVLGVAVGRATFYRAPLPHSGPGHATTRAGMHKRRMFCNNIELGTDGRNGRLPMSEKSVAALAGCALVRTARFIGHYNQSRGVFFKD